MAYSHHPFHITMLDESSQHHGTFDAAVAQAPIDGTTPVTVIDPLRPFKTALILRSVSERSGRPEWQPRGSGSLLADGHATVLA